MVYFRGCKFISNIFAQEAKMFKCKSCGALNPFEFNFCSQCGRKLPDKTEKTSVLLVPVGECTDPNQYQGEWHIVWEAMPLAETVRKSYSFLGAFSRFGVVVLFEPATIEDGKLHTSCWFSCDVFEDSWPGSNDARVFSLESTSPSRRYSTLGG